MKVSHKHLHAISLLLVFTMCLLMASASAVTFNMGTNTITAANQSMVITSYFEYSANRSSAQATSEAGSTTTLPGYVNVTSLAANVTNNGMRAVDTVMFQVLNGDFSQNTNYFDHDYTPSIEKGQTARIEVEWKWRCTDGNTKFLKTAASGTTPYVYVDICVGSSLGAVGGHEVFFYDSRLSAVNFHS